MMVADEPEDFTLAHEESGSRERMALAHGADEARDLDARAGRRARRARDLRGAARQRRRVDHDRLDDEGRDGTLDCPYVNMQPGQATLTVGAKTSDIDWLDAESFVPDDHSFLCF